MTENLEKNQRKLEKILGISSNVMAFTGALSGLTSFGINKPIEIETRLNSNKLELNPFGYFNEQFNKYLGE